MEGKVFNKDHIDNIYYHANCTDGICSLNIILYYLGDDSTKVRCIPMMHPYTVNDEFFENAKGKNNIMVDFSLNYNDLQRLIDVSNTFLILDHHKSAEEELRLIDENLKIFRMDKAGAGLAWDYFFPDRPRPQVVTFVEDQDLWTFKHPDTKAFNTVFHGLKQTYDLWLKYVTDEDLVKETIIKGRAMLEYESTLVSNTCNWNGDVRIHDIDGKYVIIANVNSSMLVSQIGNTLIKKNPYADFASVISIKNGMTKFSLRSEDSRFDVSEIAKSFPKGGGHRNAASFSLKGLYDRMPYPVVDDNWVIIDALKTGHIDESKIPSGGDKFKELINRKF